MRTKGQYIPVAFVLTLLAACGKIDQGPLPFATKSVRSVLFERIGKGAYGQTPEHDTLATDRIDEFVEGLRGARDKGPIKVWTDYRIIFTLTDGSRFTLNATETMFGTSNAGQFYEFNGGRYFLRRYFPALFQDTVGTIQNI